MIAIFSRSKIFVLLSLVGSIASAQSHGRSSLESTVHNAINFYTAQENIALGDTTSSFTGFSFERREATSRVVLFHADSPIDISFREYECSDMDCELISVYPRCFYHAETGGFSISNFITALRFGLDTLLSENVRHESVSMVKFWQSGGNIYGKISFEESNYATKKAFVCDKSLNFQCEESGSNLPNEP